MLKKNSEEEGGHNELKGEMNLVYKKNFFFSMLLFMTID